MARPWSILDLDPDENLKRCIYKIVLTRFQETFSYELGTIKGEDPEALHDMRVAARRLRAVLRIFRDCFPKKTFKRQDERLTSLVRALGAVREQDVFIDVLRNHRITLVPREAKIVDLLLAREENARTMLRRGLVTELRSLQRSRFADSFSHFLKESL